MTGRRPNPARVAAEALFKTIAPEQKASATAEYKAGIEAARQRMAEQKAARLAKERWQAQRLLGSAPTPVFHAPTSTTKNK